MKTTDIPNGIIFRGLRGEVSLMDFDDKGNLINNVMVLSRAGPAAKGDIEGEYEVDPLNVLSFVHTVKGEEQMLIGDVFSVVLMDKQKKPLSVFNALRLGKLANMARDIRRDYIREMEASEGKAVDRSYQK